MRLVVGLLFAVNLALVLALEDSNNEHGVHKFSSSITLTNTRGHSSINSESTEQLSGDGHDEAIRLSDVDGKKQWEGSFEMVSNGGVTTKQKIEAFWGIFAAVIIAIISNIITRTVVQKLS